MEERGRRRGCGERSRRMTGKARKEEEGSGEEGTVERKEGREQSIPAEATQPTTTRAHTHEHTNNHTSTHSDTADKRLDWPRKGQEEHANCRLDHEPLLLGLRRSSVLVTNERCRVMTC